MPPSPAVGWVEGPKIKMKKNKSKEKLQELSYTHLQWVPLGLNLGNRGFMMHRSEVKAKEVECIEFEGQKTNHSKHRICLV